ncbi:MAG: efflux RND transporter periplasmic adaptor subunit [Hyphomonadaceae bacterium]
MAFPKLSNAARIWLICAALVAALVAWLVWPRAIRVEVATIDRGEVRREIAEEGRVRVHDVYTVASPVGGLLKRVQLEAGDLVSKEDVLASIAPADPSLLDARISEEAAANAAAARAALALAEVDLDLAKSDEARTRQLFERGFAAKAALDRTQAGVRAASSVVAQRKAELARSLAAQGKPGARARSLTKVRSPASGRVLRIFLESETVVSAGTPLLEIGDPEQIEIVAEFLSQDAAMMREGAAAFVENSGSGEPARATVHAVEPYARTRVSALGVEEQRVSVILNLLGETSSATPRLGHGFRVDVRILAFEEKDALRVPTDALVRHGDNDWSVFRVMDGRARLTRVSIGDGDDRFRVVTAGVAAGDRVVLFPGDTLSDGDTVQVDTK